MSNNIVTVNVSLQVPPTPPTLQKTGALISQGGTNTSSGVSSLLTQLSDLTPLLAGSRALSSLAWGSNVATATTVAPHGFTIGDAIEITIAGSVAGTIPGGYNGTFNCTITGASTFTYPLPANPGTESVPGAYTLEDVTELLAMATTFFSNGANQAVYVLELGAGNAYDGVAALSAYLTANPNSAYLPGSSGYFYSYLAPRFWDGNPAFLALLQQFNSTTGRTYFWVTTTLATYQLYSDLTKCVIALIESPQLSAYPSNALTALSATQSTNVLTAISCASVGAINTVTATTTSAHGLSPGDWFTIAGCVPGGYNGYFQAIGGTTGSTIVYLVAANPGTETTLGNLVIAAPYVTASTTTNHGVAVGSWFTISGCSPAGYNGTFQALPGTTGSTLVYAPLTLPGSETILGTLQANYFANSAISSSEFSLAAGLYVTLNYAPNATNKVTPFAFSFLFGVTPFPSRGNSALLSILKAAAVNIVGTGAEGGISDAIMLWGTTMDGQDFTYWYSVDWIQIEIDVNVSNAVINGSNNPVNPLYYNQDGINRLQAVAADVINSGVAFGLVLGTAIQTALDGTTLGNNINNGVYAGQTVVNAIPFLLYSQLNPGDYKIGQYAGFSVVYVPARGFIHIVFNVVVSQFVAQ
jgi:hypothetical protein